MADEMEANVGFKAKKVKEVKKKRSFRPRRGSGDGSDLEEGTEGVGAGDAGQEEAGDWKRLEELKAIQQSKRRVNRGVNVVELLNASHNLEGPGAPGGAGAGAGKGEEKAKAGGMVDAKSLANELDLGHTFSVETNRRDEDADMMKYIEEELAKRKGVEAAASSDAIDDLMKGLKSGDDHVFNILPHHLLASSKGKNEEMLSNQMLSGIPEVDLGIDERIRNIEVTEEAKVKLLENRHKRPISAYTSSSSSTLVPTNIAVNFVQHNRFNIEEEPGLVGAKKQRVAKPVVNIVEEPVVVIGDEPRQGKFRNYPEGSHRHLKFPGKEKATDDYHYERFRKQFRK